MRILVLGAGGVGGYFGGRLAAAGVDVRFLVRPRRAGQLAQNGLVIRSPLGDLRQKVATVVAGEVKPGYDVVMFTCKSYDLEDAIAAIAPAVGPHTAVIPFLNGLRHLERLDAAFGRERVVGGIALIAATLNAQGEILHLNDLQTLIVGERGAPSSERCVQLAAILAKASFSSRLSDNIELELWEKFVFLATLAGMTCLMRAGVGPIARTVDGEKLMLEMLEECRMVAAAEGFEPRVSNLERDRGILTDRSRPFSASMMRDIEKGGPTEGEHIVGDMLARARKHSIAAPLLRVANCHLQTYELMRQGR
jgi:2-dehydropantoate 2-reductase